MKQTSLFEAIYADSAGLKANLFFI